MGRNLLLALALGALLCLGATMNQPTYFVKVLEIDGATVAAPLDIASIEFTETVFVPGQHRPGEFTLYLHNTRNAPHLRTTYNSLEREQRIEVYDNQDLLGDPVFTGVLIRQTRDLQGNRQWTGFRSEYRLDERRLRQYHLLSGNVSTVADSLLDTYNLVFGDDFSTDSITSGDWTVAGSHVTAYSVTNGYLKRTAPDDVVPGEQTVVYPTAPYSMLQWDNAHIHLEFKFEGTDFITIATPYLAASNYSVTTVTYNALLEQAAISVTDEASGNVAERWVNFQTGVWNTLDLYVTMTTATNRRTVVVLNGVEMIDHTITTGTRHLGVPLIWAWNSTGDTVYLDNFYFSSASNALTAGTIDVSADTISQVFNGDSQLAALEWLCEQESWEYRIRPKAGAGNDIIDVGAQVGSDYTDLLLLEDGKNLVSLDVDETNEGFATQLYTYGQSRDDATSGFIATSISAIETYGFVDGEYSDERVVDSETARVVGNARLTRLAASNKSLSGRVIDESAYLAQDPKWGYAVWGDFIWGGRKQLHAGDWVRVISDDLNIDQDCEIVSLTRRSYDPGIDLVFDYHGYRTSDANRETERKVKQLTRALNRKIDTQSLVFELTGTTALTLSFNMRGTLYKNVYLDVTSAAWAGAITLSIDTVDRTNAIFGAATIAANAYGNDTTYLIYAGAHTITLTPTQTVTVTVGIRPVLMG